MQKHDKIYSTKAIFRGSGKCIYPGTIGKVLAVRPQIDNQILVKFKGYARAKSVSLNEVNLYKE